MRRLLLLLPFCVLLFSSCEKGWTEGVEDNEVLFEQIKGGWKIVDVQFQLVYNAANPLALMMPTIKEKLKDNLKSRTSDGSLYFTRDTVCYVEQPSLDACFVRAYGAYKLTSHPASLQLENEHLVCDAYASYFYVKFDENNRLCLYLTREGVMKMIRDDASLSNSTINLIDRNIDDAQFEFYLERNELELYTFLEQIYGPKTSTN